MNRSTSSKLVRNPLFIIGSVIITITVVISLGGAVIRPDSTPYANSQHLELMNLKPGTTVRFLNVIRYDFESMPRSLSAYFIGSRQQFDHIPFDSIYLESNMIYLYRYGQVHPMEMEPERIFQKELPVDLSLSKIEPFINDKTFILGTDKYGRDMLSRLMSGAYISLSVGLISVLISLLVGISLGTIAGYFRGWVDRGIVWLINVVWSVPTLLLVIAITLVLGKGFWQIFIAVGLTMWVEVARIVRGQVMSVREKEFVEAGIVLGFNDFRIITRHILPNILSPVIVISAANFATAILLEAGLSFLGIGVPPPQATWGKMISEHKSYLITGDAHLAIIPGIAIMLLVLSFTFIGNGLRDAFDEKLH